MKSSATRWWLLGTLGVLVPFVIFALAPYVALDSDSSRIPVGGRPSWYYPMLVTHVMVAAVAMLCAAGQLLPWWRARNPRWHRREGRLYVLAVAIAGPSALLIGVQSPFGPAAKISDVILAVLWMLYTTLGVRAIVGGRVADHRRWMIRSACLAFSVILNRVYAIVLGTVGAGWLESLSPGIDDPVMLWSSAIAPWLGLVSGILLGQFASDSRPGRNVRSDHRERNGSTRVSTAA